MEVNISISNTDVYTDVYIVTGQTGKGLGNIDAVSATEDEDIILAPMLAESTAELAEVVSSYGSISYGSGTISVNFVLPANWKISAKDALGKAIHYFLVNSVCVKWFATNNRGDIQFYQDKTTSNTSNIIKLLCEKTRPQRN